jgi:hypothetical protein
MRLSIKSSRYSALAFARGFLAFTENHHLNLELVGLLLLALTLTCFVLTGPHSISTVVAAISQAIDGALLVTKVMCKFALALASALSDPIELNWSTRETR